MIAVLFVGWGRSVQRDLHVIWAKRMWRIAAAGVAVAAIVGTTSIGVRVARALGSRTSAATTSLGAPQRLDLEPPAIALTDQYGQRMSFADFGGHTVLLTFAFGHCSTVCPTTVNDLIAARRMAGRPDVPLVVIMLDPWRDTPDRLQSIAERWGLRPRDRVLSGSVGDVEHALDALGIGRRRNETTGDIEHGATVMILNERGRFIWRIDGAVYGVAQLLRQTSSRGFIHLNPAWSATGRWPNIDT